MRKVYKILALTMSMLIVLPIVSYAVVDWSSMYIAESFNGFISNSTPDTDTVTVTGADKVYVHDEGGNNKSLEVRGSNAVIKREFSQPVEDKFVISFDVQNDEEDSLYIDFGYYGDDGDVLPVRIVKGIVMDEYGRRLGGVNAAGRVLNLALHFDMNLGLCTLYADGRCIRSGIVFPAEIVPKGMMIRRTGFLKTDEPLRFDNFMAYPEERYSGVVRAVGGYNSEYYDVVAVNDYCGSYCYWDNYYMYIGINRYGNNVTLSPKTNKIETTRFDYKNPQRETILRLIKSGETSDDCYIDINTADREGATKQINQTYKYYTLEGDFCVENGSCPEGQLPYIRDSSKEPNVSIAAVTIKGSNLQLSDGTTIPNVIETGKWFHYVFALDLVNSCFSIYIDDELIAENVAIDTNFTTLSMMRLNMNVGKYAVSFAMDNVSVCGFEKPYVLGECQATSIYYDDSVVGEFYEDKIAFHAYGKNALIHNVKHELGENIRIEEETGRVFVQRETLESLTQWEISGSEDFVDVETAAKENGLETFNNETGLVICADHELHFDMTNEYKWEILRPYNEMRVGHVTQLDALNDYAVFDRPSAETLKSMMTEKLGGYDVHPRLLMDETGFDNLRALYQTDTDFKKLADAIISNADVYATQEPRGYEFTDEYRMLATFNDIRDRMSAWGFAYQMTGDAKYPEAAWKQFEKIITFPDANPHHIIDTGSLNEGIGIGFDWMYDAFSQDQRAAIEQFVRKHSIGKVANGFYGLMSANSPATSQWSSFKVSGNYNAWVLGGIYCAALAFAEYDVDYYLEMVSLALRGVEYSARGFAPDGGWMETPGYGDIVAKYLSHIVSSSEISFGTAFGIPDYQGISSWGKYRTSVSGYERTATIGDGSNEEATTNSNMYLDKYFGNDSYRAIRQYYTLTDHVTTTLLDALYYDPALTMEDVQNAPLSAYTRGLETVSVRQSYTNPEGMYFITTGGLNNHYHSHYDTGMFLFELDGVQWAVDLGSEDYNIDLNEQLIYRKRSEAHNVLTMNIQSGKESMTNEGFAEVERFESNRASNITVLNMDGIYNETDTYRRGFFIGDQMRSLTVRDECTLNTDSTVYWFMNTKADVQINGDEAILTQDGKTLSVKIDCDVADYVFGVMDAKSLVTLPSGATGQNPNTDYQKLFIKMDVKQGVPFHVTARLCAPDEAAYATPMLTSDIAEWTLEADVGPAEKVEKVSGKIFADGKEINSGTTVLSVRADGSLPEIDVEPVGLGKSVEIAQAKSIADKTYITVWDENKTSFWSYAISYSDFDMELLKEHKVATPIELMVSSTPEAANRGSNMIDNNLETRWTCFMSGEYALLDLGETLDVNGVAMAFWKSAERSYSFEVHTSTDGETFTKVAEFTSEKGPEEYEVFSFTKTPARYVKIVCRGSDANINTNILELRALYE